MGERRLQLKWLATGAAVTLVVVVASLGFSSTSVVGEILGIGLDPGRRAVVTRYRRAGQSASTMTAARSSSQHAARELSLVCVPYGRGPACGGRAPGRGRR